MASNVHVIPTQRNGWAVEVEDTDGPVSLYPTQEEAIAAGTEKAKRAKAELLIHGHDGQIRERNSFGRDPHDAKG